MKYEADFFKKQLIFNMMIEDFFGWFIGTKKRQREVTSLFRTPEHNASINGSPTSRHLKGLACDIPFPDDYYTKTYEEKKKFEANIAKRVRETAERFNTYSGMGWYDWGFHIDFLDRTTHGTWDLR